MSAVLLSCGGKADRKSENTKSASGKGAAEKKVAMKKVVPVAPMGTQTTAVKKGKPANKTGDAAKVPQRFTKLVHFLDLWNSLFNANEPVINQYKGMPILGLVTPALGLVTSPQYDMINSQNKDGRFEGKLLLAGKKAFIEKKGAVVTFGYRQTLEKDGYGPAAKKGDVKVEQGVADLDKGYYSVKMWTERAGKKISHNNYEFKKLADGSMICLYTADSTFRKRRTLTFIFLHNGKAKYDFVVAKGKKGVEFKDISFGVKGTLDKAGALKLAADSGYVVKKKGGIRAGALVLDK